MGFLVFLVIIFVGGLIVGALARLAVPGPDPMPIWATAALGIGGSIIGGVISRILFGTGAGFFFAFLGAVLLLVLYRHFVQHRPLTGPGARQPPPSR
ncbi:MAG: GlsB/YeaQ/YmgE family stress response membrane protein [Gaiellaceae bacterium]